MATEKAETDRVPITLALSTIAYLEKLVRQGTHGTSVPGVAKTLIEEGIRLAIKDGLLSIRDNGKTPKGAFGACGGSDANEASRVFSVITRSLGPSTCPPTHPPGPPNASNV